MALTLFASCAVKDEQLETDVDAVLMVDVGGGVGSQVGAPRKLMSRLPGKCILQDLHEQIGIMPRRRRISK